jgi:hypothetical protein
VRALAANRQRTTMTQAAVATQVHQALDVHRNFTTQVTFDLVVSIDCFADLKDFSIRQLVNATIVGNANLRYDFPSKFRSNPVDVLKRNNNALVRRDVDASDTCHVCSP